MSICDFITLEVRWGGNINEARRYAESLSHTTGRRVVFKFNTVTWEYFPNGDFNRYNKGGKV